MQTKFLHYLLLLLYSYSPFHYQLKAQNDTLPKTSALIAGVGNYEYQHIGINVPIKKKWYFESSLGLKPHNYKIQKYFMSYLSIGRTLFNKKQWAHKLFPGIQLKALVWYLEDASFQFSFVAINPEIKLGYKINSHIQLVTNLGGLYNIQLYYHRKNYQDVGWPFEWQPSFSIKLLYLLK